MLASLLTRKCIVIPMLLYEASCPQKDLRMACELNSCAVLSKYQWMGAYQSVRQIDRSSAAKPAQALGSTNLACDNGKSVNLYGQTGDSGGKSWLELPTSGKTVTFQTSFGVVFPFWLSFESRSGHGV